MPPYKGTYISLKEITPQHSLAPSRATSYDPLHQRHDDQLHGLTLQHFSALPRSTSYNPIRQNDDDEQLLVPLEKPRSGMANSWKSTVALGAVMAGTLLLVNLGFFIYMMKQDGLTLGFVTIFTGKAMS